LKILVVGVVAFIVYSISHNTSDGAVSGNLGCESKSARDGGDL
jgi:hypothetical protein